MNQAFSFQRWSLLVGKQWADNRKQYLLAIIAFMSLVLVWYVFTMLVDRSDPMAEGLQHITYLFSLFIVGPFYASQFFRQLSSKSKGIDYLMVPASSLEKLLCAIFYGIILFLLVFTVAFYTVDIITVALANLFHPSYSTVDAEGVSRHAHVVNIFKVPGNPVNIAYYFFLMFLAVQSAFLLGSVYFIHYSYIKTVIGLTLACLVIALVGFYFTDLAMPLEGYFNPPATYHVLSGDGKNKLVELPHWIGSTLKILFFYAFPPIFWVTTYFRLKEKEV
jgi:hypothetical protein